MSKAPGHIIINKTTGQVEVADEKRPPAIKTPENSSVPKRSSKALSKAPRKAPVSSVKNRARRAGDDSDGKDRASKAPRIRKPHRFKPGTVALREIRKYQKTTDNLIKRTPFKRLLRETLDEIKGEDNFRLSPNSIEAFRDATEAYLVDLFEAINHSAIHARRVTIFTKDLGLVRRLRKDKI